MPLSVKSSARSTENRHQAAGLYSWQMSVPALSPRSIIASKYNSKSIQAFILIQNVKCVHFLKPRIRCEKTRPRDDFPKSELPPGVTAGSENGV
ncbi:Hypothetical protein NTJ_14413 [Nesidiocoris tenuis]|uniref:Uncharacterized protein n=1 Tax=Nesidiocoris tenuis TaxID=355587 RepID=A0ABN7BEN3_9HEMI|nr:Hypothetical protein NTJ_14413 [Nesidiocoris tenuis]